MDSTKNSTVVTTKSDVEPKDWIADLALLLKALESGDLDRQKSYFSFPINADTTQIWYVVYDQIAQEEWPASFPETFGESDYERHYQNLFTNDFIKGLSKINLDSLKKKGQYTTPMIDQGEIPYYLAVHHLRASSMLQLTLSYAGQLDDNGNHISEGEYALIYFFKIKNGKSLLFDKMLFAG